MSISRVDVGTPPKDFEGWTTANVCFHGFANLTTTRGEGVESPQFSCFGHQWRLEIYPGGDVNSGEGYVAVELANRSNTSIKLHYSFSVRNEDDKEAVHTKSDIIEFAEVSCQVQGIVPGVPTTLPNVQRLWNY